jgi:hypothetical protein
VIRGIDVVRKVQSGATNASEQLIEPITIVRVHKESAAD